MSAERHLESSIRVWELLLYLPVFQFLGLPYLYKGHEPYPKARKAHQSSRSLNATTTQGFLLNPCIRSKRHSVESMETYSRSPADLCTCILNKQVVCFKNIRIPVRELSWLINLQELYLRGGIEARCPTSSRIFNKTVVLQNTRTSRKIK